MEKPTALIFEDGLKPSELARITELGLGRGVDATDPKPWAHKSSFQVRHVTCDDIICTDEGGTKQSYEREISSAKDIQASAKASVQVSALNGMKIGVDAERSRGTSATRKAVGEKVINRSVSFKADFVDTLQSVPKKGPLASLEVDHESPVAVRAPTFEERLTAWITETDAGPLTKVVTQKTAETKGPLPQKRMPELVLAIHHNMPEEELRKRCCDFINYFHITHYVSSINLGAVQYRVFTEQQYYSKMGTMGSFGLDRFASSAVSASYSYTLKKKASSLRKIGEISKEGRVERNSYSEAVVQTTFTPLSDLVKNSTLRQALQEALALYVHERTDQLTGPFLIACHEDTVFWKVNHGRDYAVEGTTDINEASLFHIFPNDDGKHPYEFVIGYYKDCPLASESRAPDKQASTPAQDKQKEQEQASVPQQDTHKIPRFLDTSVNLFGMNSGPLHLKDHVQEHHSQLALKSRMLRKSPLVEINTWVSSKEVFFINCARRPLRKDGYICMKRVRAPSISTSEQEPEFITACVPSTWWHDERDTFMLFHLLPPPKERYDHQKALMSSIAESMEEAKPFQQLMPRLESFDTSL